jgi:hypothetical protein
MGVAGFGAQTTRLRDTEYKEFTMEKLLDFPVSAADYKVSVRDFKAGSKSAIADINKRGLSAAVRYFNSKEPYITKYNSNQVISYWAGVQAALASWIKEFENANTSAS